MFGFNFFFSRAGTKTIVVATDTSEKKSFCCFFENVWTDVMQEKKWFSKLLQQPFQFWSIPVLLKNKKKKVDKIFLCCLNLATSNSLFASKKNKNSIRYFIFFIFWFFSAVLQLFLKNLFVTSEIFVEKKMTSPAIKHFFSLFYYYHCNYYHCNWESKKIFKVVSTDKNNKNTD